MTIHRKISNKRLPKFFAVIVLSAAFLLVGAVSAASDLFTTPGELSPDDMRISYMGPDGNPNYHANFPAAAYNSQRDEFLVVWDGNDESIAVGEKEIWGQRIDGSTGERIGGVMRISQMSPSGDPGYSAQFPDVAYNSIRDEFLVVLQGNDYISGYRKDFEIWGQRMDYNDDNLQQKGVDFKISQMGPPPPQIDAEQFNAEDPALVYNSQVDEYLLVWSGNDKRGGLADYEHEIFGQRLGYTAFDEMEEKGNDDYRISYMGTTEDASFHANAPDLAYNTLKNEYLVVWYGNTNAYGLADDEREIWGKRVNWDISALSSQLRISDMGEDGQTSYLAHDPAVAYNPYSDRYLVVWFGNEVFDVVSGYLMEVFGQQLGYDEFSNLANIESNDFQISHLGMSRYDIGRVLFPEVAYNTHNRNYLIVWRGDYDNPPLVPTEYELYGQVMDYKGNLYDPKEFRLSETGVDGDLNSDVLSTSVAAGLHDSYLVVWFADPGTAPLVDYEEEVFGQLYTTQPPNLMPIVMK